MPFEISPTSVIRVSRGDFDPARFEEISKMVQHTGEYLIPKLQELSGLNAYVAAASPTGSMVHVSLWQSDEHASQMSRLREMIVNARQEAEAAGVRFIPIVNYPIAWHVDPKGTA